jgi:MFS family permease
VTPGPDLPTGNGSARTWLVITTLACCGTVTALQQTLVLPLLPELPHLLGTSPSNASWLITATLLAGAVATPVATRLADMYGKRLLITACLAVMVTGSVCGALGTSLGVLIVARALQGVGTALIPIGIAAMRDELPSSRVPLGVALMSATLAIGAGVGPPVSGLITQYLDWHMIFWITGAMGLVMLVAVPLVVGPSPFRTRGRFDVRGAAVLLVALTAVLLALSKGSQWGWSSGTTLVLAAGGLLLLLLFVPLERRTAAPLVDVRATARPAVLLVSGGAVFLGFGMYVNLLISTELFQLPTGSGAGLGLSAFTTGLWMAPTALAFGAMAPLSAQVINRLGGETALLAGCLVMAAAYLGRAFFSHTLWQIVAAAVLVSLGTSLAYAALPILVMAAVPETETASANGVNTLMRSIGMSTCSAVAAAVLVATAAADGTPTRTGLLVMFWLAVGACAVAAGLTVPLLQRRRQVTTGPELLPAARPRVQA